jgi:hypothetical protein
MASRVRVLASARDISHGVLPRTSFRARLDVTQLTTDGTNAFTTAALVVWAPNALCGPVTHSAAPVCTSQSMRIDAQDQAMPFHYTTRSVAK